MMKEHYKHPRLYLKTRLEEKERVVLSPEQAHYLKTVLRKSVGDIVRVFNGQDGEWLSTITELEKKQGALDLYERIREQKPSTSKIHLYFAPIKKQRLDILIEKAVELGASEFHPVITNRTENRKLNMDRINAQIFEAAEQCERLEIPVLNPAMALPQILRKKTPFQLFVCVERGESKPLGDYSLPEEFGILIGPEGGFDDEEMDLISRSGAQAVSLGEAVLRAETAVLSCLSFALLSKQS